MEVLDRSIETMVLSVPGLKERRLAVDKALPKATRTRRKICLYDSIVVWNAIYKHDMVINDYEIADGFLGCL